MLKKITATTAQQALGRPPGRKLFRIESGPYRGRMAALVQTAPGTIQLFWADHPYRSWSSGQTVVSDADDQAFDAVMETAGDIHLVYSEQTTDYLVTRRLAFSNGAWSVGGKVTVFNGNPAYDPAIVKDTGGVLWVAYARFVSPNRSIYVKSSSDNGATWGTGAADPGDLIVSAGSQAWAKLVLGADDLYAVYTTGNTGIAMKSRPLSGGNWSAESLIFSSTAVTDHFDAAVSPAGRLAVAFVDSQLKYREFDGVAWSSVTTLDDRGDSPQVLFRDGETIVVYTYVVQGAQRLLRWVRRSGGQWSAPQPLDTRAATFDSVWLYDQSSQTYEDLTTAAGSTATADIYHSGSGALLKNVGDRLFLGLAEPFRYVQFVLSTAGVGGTVTYSYWDGAAWKPFTPSGGVSHLDTTINRVVLWDDYTAIPADWRKHAINNQVAFWIRLEVTAAYTTPPVGSYITAVSETYPVICRR